MRITRIELTDFRTFRKVLLDDIPEMALFVSSNGLGKSSLLEAIAGVHELVAPYQTPTYQFRENWRGQSSPVWPAHLRQPVRFGARQAVIRLEVKPNQEEQKYLEERNVTDTTGTAEFVIEYPRYIVDQKINDVIKHLFEYHPPTSGIGYLDYLKPIRIYPSQGVGAITESGTDNEIKQMFAEFARGWNDPTKFTSFKTFIVSSVLNDATATRQSGRPTDSLATFREVFDFFFSPKQFIGPKQSAPGAPIEILIKTPNGDHDTDLLSDGEKEILNVMANLFRFRHLSNIVLWDSPEAHLNAALESRLYSALLKIAPNNQYWITTHGLELIGSVPIENVFVIKQRENDIYIERVREENKKTRVAIYRELGANVGLQLVSSLVVFVEGKEADSDKRILERLIGASLPAVTIVAGGDCDSILSVGARANALLQDAITNGDFMAIVDRDYRSDDERSNVERNYKDRVFVWNVHEIENLFLQPKVVYQTLKVLDQAAGFSCEEDIYSNLHEIATGLRDWIAADWVRWEIDQQIRRPSGFIRSTDPLLSLKEYGTRVIEAGQAITALVDVEKAYHIKLAEIQRFLSSRQWLDKLPGKQLLKSFLQKHTKVDPKMFIATAVSTIQTQGIVLPELDRLTTKIKTVIGRPS